KLQHWTFVWIYSKQAVKPCNNHAEDLSVASINPGVHTFLTWYSPMHGHGKIGDGDINRIIRLCLSLDNLCSRTSHAPACKRNSMRRAQARMRHRIKDLANEVHKKAALWFIRTFDAIMIPEFNSSAMSQWKNCSQTVCKMLSWGHSRFRQQLVSKAEEHGKVMFVSEAYTSKCRYIKNNLRGAKTYRCNEEKCRIIIDRDATGTVTSDTPIPSKAGTRRWSSNTFKAYSPMS
ncbi:hypothetical protein BC938DRAFT_481239, partial [Jimgerdemannia flammicorona]